MRPFDHPLIRHGLLDHSRTIPSEILAEKTIEGKGFAMDQWIAGRFFSIQPPKVS